jgi:hypothetical protein
MIKEINMDIHELPGKWIKAKVDLEFEIHSVDLTIESSKRIKIAAGRELQVYAAIKSVDGNTILVVVQYEENKAFPIEFELKNWVLI